jgi:hypothetical protein
MATETFTGDNGDPLPAGWAAVNGTFEKQSNKLTATGSAPGGPSWVATTLSTADGTFSVIFNAEGGNSSASGVVARGTDGDNLFFAGINSTGLTNLYRREAGAWSSTLGTTHAIPAFNASADYKIGLVTAGTSLVVQIDDVDVITDVPAQTFNETATLAGVRFGDTDASLDDFTYPSPAATPFLTVDQGNYHSQQQVGGSRTVTFTGTHGNQTGALHYKLNGGAAVVGVATPAGSTWAIAITLPEGNHSIEFFFADNVSVTQTLTNVIVSDVFHIDGQSKASGFGGNNQAFVPNGSHIATFFGNDDIYRLAADPFDSNVNQIRAISSYANAGGSWAIHFANSYVAGQNKSVCLVPNSIGSVGIDRLLKTDTTRIGGLNLWEARAERIALTGGCKYIIVVGGETNIAAGATKTVFKGWLNQYVDDNFADYGVKTVIVPFQTLTKTGYDGNGTTTGQIPLRAAQVEVGNENANAILVDPTTDILLLTTGDEDGLHNITDAQKQAFGERIYSRVVGSVLSMTITGLPDAPDYTVDFTDPTTGELVARQTDIEFISGVGFSKTLDVTDGVTLEYTIRTPTHVIGDSGVTA